ncbi:hypothetical protein [Poseidonocella sp. HB161398]|uniref:hypothetical protein n=1 Tax=Poseidonocella sp. HB161398 TaxID=2320855 RepID=UPI001107CC65|nr:hypothetical protein [Poseidonocella sp. HB161398]
MTRIRRVARAAALAVLACLGGTGTVRAEHVVHVFQWQGNGGYAMEGALAYDSALARDGLVTGAEIDCFFILGRHDGAEIGRWSLGELDAGTDWIVTFLPGLGAFAVYSPVTAMPQAWNMDGTGTSCGAGGFGFNIGNAAQDLCLDGQLLAESQVAPERAFPATPAPAEYVFPPGACLGPMLTSRLSLPEAAERPR